MPARPWLPVQEHSRAGGGGRGRHLQPCSSQRLLLPGEIPMETGQEPCGALQACRAGLAGPGGLGLGTQPAGPLPLSSWPSALGSPGSWLGSPSLHAPPPLPHPPRGFSRSRHGAVGRQEVPRLSQHLREKSSKCEVLGGTPPRKVLQAQQAAPWRRPSLVGAQPLPELSPSGPGLPCLKTLCRPGPFP